MARCGAGDLQRCPDLCEASRCIDDIRPRGIEIVDIEALRPVHQVPVEHWSPSGRVLSQNAFWFEPLDRGLRLSFVPDDGRSAVRIFDLRVE